MRSVCSVDATTMMMPGFFLQNTACFRWELRKSEQLCVHVSEPAQGGHDWKYLKVSVVSKKFGARSGEESNVSTISAGFVSSHPLYRT